MGQFKWWQSTESIDHDFANDERLTVEEAQVFATLQMAEASENIAAQLKDLMYFLEHHSVSIKVEDEGK
jgi:hypothetical protein